MRGTNLDACADPVLEAASEVILDVAFEVDTDGTMEASCEWAAVSRWFSWIRQASSLLCGSFTSLEWIYVLIFFKYKVAWAGERTLEPILRSRVTKCLPLGVNEGVSIHLGIKASPLGAKFTHRGKLMSFK
jgi:hypothetical protein